MPILRFFSKLCFFGAPILILLVGAVVFSLHSVFGFASPDDVDRMTLIRIMQLRNFKRLTPNELAAWTDRAEAEFGRLGAQKPLFDFSETERKIYAYFRENPSERKSRFETNLMLMARTRYFSWMNTWSELSDDRRQAFMQGVADDMKYWETVYMDFLRAAKLPIPSIAELIREFDAMIDGFKIGATEEEIVRIDDFKQRMNAAIVAREVRGAVGTVSSVLGTFFSPGKAEKKQRKKSDDTDD